MTTDPTPIHLPWRSALLDPRTYPHPVDDIQVVETHISVVALTGPFAYKLKKPVKFSFIDFSTLARRHWFCTEEVRLNQRTAPDLYLDVVPLVQAGSGYCFGGEGEIVEHALRMRQFAPQDRLDRVAARGQLADALLIQLADEVARLHSLAGAHIPSIAATHPERLRRIFEENSLLLPDTPQEQSLRERFAARLRKLSGLLGERARCGRVRECHGDLHLGNICMWKGRPVLFDCIEFSEDLRVIDVLSDTAFLYMDLINSGLLDGAVGFLNRYLEKTSDYGGLEAWPLFLAYRAHVRAMVAHLTSRAADIDPAAREELEARRQRYLAFSAEALEPPRRGIVLTVGLPGSGKSTEALRIARSERGVRIRSDVERKRIHSTNPTADLYSAEMNRLTYEVMVAHARAASIGGLLPVLDASFLRQADRARVLRLAYELQVPLRILHLTAPLDVLESRIAARRSEGTDPSDANAGVLRQMATCLEPFTPEEKLFVTELRQD